MGCPTTYDGKNATWLRGRLSRLYSGTSATGTTNFGYSYNAFGQRVSKSYSYTAGTSGSNPIYSGQLTSYSKKYFYDHSGRLIAETVTKSLYNQGTANESIVFLYDESGVVGMEYTTGGVATLYYFQRNLQGDVEAIYDTNGNMVARYLYDAWGNCTISSETTNAVVANANPIRYRGYYLDDDTGLYYCNARYYSPKWRRFISPDDTAYLDPDSVNGLNLYCYCNNDPVNFVDPSGHEWYNPFTWDWGKIASGVGLIITGLVAIGVGIVTLPFGGWISVVAGITILAGAGTTLFGASDVGEGITGYNLLQNTLFEGNEQAYNLAENIFMYTAIIGTSICGIYGATHTQFVSDRSTPRLGKSHSGRFNMRYKTLTYYGYDGQMKYSMHLFDKGHQWVHWHTEMLNGVPKHSKPINNFFAFMWSMLQRGF